MFAEEIYEGKPARRRAMYQTIQAYLARVGEIVEHGQATGAIRKDVEPATAAVMFLGLVQPAAILWSMSGGKFDVAAHSGRAWKVYVEAIRSR